MQLPVLLLACGLGLLALAYVLYPMYCGRLAKPAPATSLPVKDRQSSPSDSEQSARLSLQEVELDYQLGNIAESDYRSLRERYMRRAILAMKTRHENMPNEQLASEHEQDSYNGQDSEIDMLIEEQLRNMRARNDTNDGGNDEE